MEVDMLLSNLVTETGALGTAQRIGPAAVTVRSGSVTPDADTSTIVISEAFAGAQAVVIACDERDALDAGENTIYGAKGLIASDIDFASAVNLLYFYVNSGSTLSAAGTSADNSGGQIQIGVAGTRSWRAGLEYHYRVYYWRD